MSYLLKCIVAISLTATSVLFAQTTSSSMMLMAPDSGDGGMATQPTGNVARSTFGGPLSHFALGFGISPLGVNLMAATNLSRHLNLRGTGNVFQYTTSNISTNGFNVTASLNLKSAGASLDFYPFANHSFRLSPGVLFYNKNAANATFNVTGGTRFTLNDTNYYASSTNPVTGVGTLGLHTQNPAFTATLGWGNAIPRKGGHWSFPFEIGAAFIGAPALNIALNSGQVCDGAGLNCVNVATDASVQSNLQAQIAKYKNDLDPLKTYPIISFGVAYSLRIR